jgi:hypothetical protein
MSKLSFKNRRSTTLRPYIYNTIHLQEKFAFQNSSKLSPMKQITEEENTRRCRHYTFVHKTAVGMERERSNTISPQNNELTRGTT